MPHEAPWQQDAQQGMEPGNKQDAITSSETESRRMKPGKTGNYQNRANTHEQSQNHGSLQHIPHSSSTCKRASCIQIIYQPHRAPLVSSPLMRHYIDGVFKMPEPDIFVCISAHPRLRLRPEMRWASFYPKEEI